MGSESTKDPRWGLNTYLLALTLSCLVPIMAISGIAVLHAGFAYKETATTRLNDTSLTLANAIEADLEGRFTILGVLPSFDPLAAQMRSARLSMTRFEDIGLDGEIEIVEQGDAGLTTLHPDSGVATAQRAIAAQMPVVSNLMLGETQVDHRLSLALPLDPLGGRQRAIVLTTTPDQLIRTLQQHNKALAGILVAVTDGNGRIIARSRDQERVIGMQAPDWEKLEALGQNSGWFEAITTEGLPTILSFQKLQGTPGWTIVVGEPIEVFNARWRDPLIGLAFGGLLAFGLAMAVAIRIGRSIIRPVAALAARSEAIAEGTGSATLAPLPTSAVREFEILRRNVTAAEKVRNEAERRALAVAQAGALVLWRWEPEGDLVWVKGWKELTGTPESEALGVAWLNRVHPDDCDRVVESFRRTMVKGGPVDIEFRLRTSDDRWMWVRDRGAPVPDNAGNIVQWAGVLEDIDKRKQTEGRIAHMAHHDGLTDLGNRTLLHERLEQAARNARRGEGSAILMLDLDRFKQVNDTLGHPVGDALLRAVADRLRGCVRETDFVARVGGDEFAIIQHDNAQPEAAAALAYRLIETISAPYEIDGHHIVTGTSAGIAFIVDDNPEPDDCLKRADKALYRAKEDGRGRAFFYEQDQMLDELTAMIGTTRQIETAIGPKTSRK